MHFYKTPRAEKEGKSGRVVSERERGLSRLSELNMYKKCRRRCRGFFLPEFLR